MKIPSSCLPTFLPSWLSVCMYVCLYFHLYFCWSVCFCACNWFIQDFSWVFWCFCMIFKRLLKSKSKRAKFLCKTLENTALSKNSLKLSRNLVFNVFFETWSLRFSLRKPKSYYEMLLNPAITWYRNIIFLMLQSKILSKKWIKESFNQHYLLKKFMCHSDFWK